MGPFGCLCATTRLPRTVLDVTGCTTKACCTGVFNGVLLADLYCTSQLCGLFRFAYDTHALTTHEQAHHQSQPGPAEGTSTDVVHAILCT